MKKADTDNAAVVGVYRGDTAFAWGGLWDTSFLLEWGEKCRGQGAWYS